MISALLMLALAAPPHVPTSNSHALRGTTAQIIAQSVAAVGHSILHGISPLLVPTEVGQLLGRDTPSDLAVGGSRTADCVSRFNASVSGVARWTSVVWQCGANDIIDGTDGLTLFNAARVPLDAAVAQGKYVVVNSELPCGGHGPCTSTKMQSLLFYNGLMNAWAAENGAHARYAGNYGWFVVTDGGEELNPNDDSGDGLHLLDGGTDPVDGGYLGSDKLARLIVAAVSAGPVGAQAGGELIHISNAGMGAPCANAIITTDDGGAVTATRAGTAFCNKKGYARTGITNSDLVLVSADRLRIEAGYDGGMRIRRESSGTNDTAEPTGIGTGTWANVSSPNAITITGNAAVAPDGTSTATRLQLGATPGASDYSVTYQLTGCTTGSGTSHSVWAKGVSTSGTIDVCNDYNSTSLPYHCFDCAFVAGSWTLCASENFTVSTVAPSLVLIGNAPNYNGGITRVANDVYVWGMQCEKSETATSLMNPTRGTETVAVAFTASGNYSSFAATVDEPTNLKAGRTWAQAYWDASNDSKAYVTLPAATYFNTCDFRTGGSSSTVSSTASPVAGTFNHQSCAYVAGVKRSCVAGTCTPVTPVALTLPTGAGTLYVGGRSAAGNEANALVGDVSLSTTSSGSQ